MEPKALLLDEPLGDLDRLLRLRMRVELRALQRQLGLMFIHVTHDQEEALSVGDRIVVMHEGRIEQVADPFTISEPPRERAGGLLHGRQQHLRRHGDRERGRPGLDRRRGRRVACLAPEADAAVGQSAAVLVRSAAVRVGEQDASANGPNQLLAEIEDRVPRRPRQAAPRRRPRLVAKVPGDRYPEFQGKEGSSVRLSWKEEDVRLLRSWDRPVGLRLEEIVEAEQVVGEQAPEEAALGEKERAGARGRAALTTAAWTAPGAVWPLLPVAPVLMIVLVSFWTRTVSGFESVWTLENYRFLFDSNIYWDQLWNSFWHSLVIVALSLDPASPRLFPRDLRHEPALPDRALHHRPRPVLDQLPHPSGGLDPMMGREGALNTALQEVGLIKEPLDILLFSDFAVTVAMLQLYILFMVAPIFFMLAQIDRSSLEAARDLGANAFKTFREVVPRSRRPASSSARSSSSSSRWASSRRCGSSGAAPSPRSGRSSRLRSRPCSSPGRGQRGLPRPRDDPRRLRSAGFSNLREDL